MTLSPAGSSAPASRLRVTKQCLTALPEEAKRGLYYWNMLRVFSQFNQVRWPAESRSLPQSGGGVPQAGTRMCASGVRESRVWAPSGGVRLMFTCGAMCPQAPAPKGPRAA